MRVLVNKFGITDEDKLSELETVITYSISAKLFLAELKPDFDFSNYKGIHYQLFNGLYDWAGKIRTIPILKKENCFYRSR